MDNKRVELKDGNWAEMRTAITVGDLKFQRQQAHDRAFDDPMLDGLLLLQRVVTSWSYGEVSEATIDALSLEDATVLIGEMNQTGKDPSTNTPDGGTGKRARKNR